MKIIIEKANNEVVYCKPILELTENGLIGENFTASNITSDYYELIDNVDNVPDDYMGRHYTYNKNTGEWAITQTGLNYRAEKLQEAKQAKLQQVQDKRKIIQDEGFLVNVNGNDILFDSDLSARVAYSELGMQFMTNPEFATSWKASNGVWVTMDYELYQNVMIAGKTHIESCFMWQANKEIEINAATTIDDVNAIEI